MKKTKSKGDLIADFMAICSEIEDIAKNESFDETDLNQLEISYDSMIEEIMNYDEDWE